MTVKKMADIICRETGTLPAPKTRPKRVPVHIEMDGRLVKLNSGKSVWAYEGAAKCALRDHLKDRLASIERADGVEWNDPGKIKDDDLYGYLVESGRVRFVPLVET